MNTIKLYNNDCLEVMDELINQNIKVDMICADLPYQMTRMSWDIIIPFEPMWELVEKIIKPNGAIVFFGSQPFTSKLIMSNEKLFKYELIWDKVQGKQPFLAHIQPMKSHENILVFGKGKITYNPQMTQGKPYTDKRKGQSVKTEHYTKFERQSYENKSERFPTTIIKCNNPNHKGMHPTEKPIKLLEWLIKTYSNENEIVLDFCMGSGSCGIAAINTNRHFIGIEKDSKIFAKSEERINNYQKK